MRLELIKTVKKKSLEIVCEVDFYKQSPYIELLNDIANIAMLQRKMESMGASKAAIKNIIKNFESLGIIKNGEVCDISSGFPEREYGKYEITYIENESPLPFQYRKHSIKRISPVSSNLADKIEQLDKQIANCLLSEDEVVERDSFRLVDNRNLYGIPHNETAENCVICSDDGNIGRYKIGHKEFDMDSFPDKNTLFEGKWNTGADRLVENFNNVLERYPDSLKSFQISYSKNNIEIGDLGIIKEAKFQNIPIMPDRKSYKEWFLYLLKDEVESSKRYFTFEETEQIWNNVWYKTTPIATQYSYPFKFSDIRNHYTKEDEFYWFMNAGNDLNPYKIKTEEARVSITTLTELVDKISLVGNADVLIIDRYVNTLRHFRSLEGLIGQIDGKCKVTLVTQEPYNQSPKEIDQIESLCRKYDVKVIKKRKTEIPHDRLWRIDKSWFTLSKSIDFIKHRVNLREIEIEPVFVTPITFEDIEIAAQSIIKEVQ